MSGLRTHSLYRRSQREMRCVVISTPISNAVGFFCVAELYQRNQKL
uniref:Uncharacterized protein n=1 Tax=Mandrillus leucophaeus TaxID=9568 RepID=A0A2K5YLH0_MANLE